MSANNVSHDAPAKISDNATTPEKSAAQHLSQSIFANPQDFLNTLKKDFNDYDRNGAGEITKQDLFYYSKEGADPTARAAAQIAYDHYDQLIDFEQGAQYNATAVKDPVDGKISQSGLSVDLALVSGQKNSVILKEAAANVGIDLTLAGAAGALGTAAAFSAPEIPISAMAAGAAVAAGGSAALLSYETYKAPAITTNRANVETSAINSWIHSS